MFLYPPILVGSSCFSTISPILWVYLQHLLAAYVLLRLDERQLTNAGNAPTFEQRLENLP